MCVKTNQIVQTSSRINAQCVLFERCMPVLKRHYS